MRKYKNDLIEIELRKYSGYQRDKRDYRLKYMGAFEEKDPNGLPIPPRNLWIGYGKTIAEYLGSADRHFEGMMRALNEAGVRPPGRGARILDFGCGAGRLTRKFHAIASDSEVFGTDISAAHVYWAQMHLSPPFRFILTTTIPHLPFRDGYFDFIYAGSVFTHIDDLAATWLCELRRTLAQDGVLYVTIQDEHAIATLERDNSLSLAKKLADSAFFRESREDSDLLVINRGAFADVFYKQGCFQRFLENADMTFVGATPMAYGYQTGIIASPAERPTG